MLHKKSRLFLLVFCLFFLSRAYALVNIVTAENFYGDVTKEIGGVYVNVTSILNNPNQDPHLFTTSPSTAKAITHADMVVYNGADYDPWILPLLTDQKIKYSISVAELMNIKKGSNPHIWYIPTTMSVYAKKLVENLSQLDPLHRDYFQAQLKKFNQSSQQIIEKVNYLKQKFNNTPYIATEPVFYYMADAIGLKNHGEGFQLSMMNDVPPSFSQVKQFENDLRQHTVNIFIFNDQVINPSTQKMLAIAQQENIPVVGVSETMPIHLHYAQWIMQELSQLEDALKKSEETHRDKK